MSSPPTLTRNHCLNQNWEFRQAGEKTVTLRLFDNIPVAKIRKTLTVYSYRESYLD